MSNKSNILLKILIVVALILAVLVFYSNKIIHEKPTHEENVVVTSVVMPHPPLSDKHEQRDDTEEKILNESNESEKYVKGAELNNSSIELTPNVPKDEIEVIADDSLDEPEVVINDETEILDDSIEEPSLIGNEEVEIIDNTPQEQISIEQPNNDLGTRIGDEAKKQNVDLGVQLF